MNAKKRNVSIVKFAFLGLVVAYILQSIWVIILDYKLMKQAQQEYPDDWYTGEKRDGYYAKFFFIACCVVVAVSDLLSVGAFYGVSQESSQIVMIYSCLMFVVAVYAGWDRYMKQSFTAFLVPLATGIVGILYGSLNHLLIFEGTTLPDVSIKYMAKTRQPTTPTVETFEEAEKLRMPDP